METPQLLACLAAAAPAASLPRSCATWLPWNRSGPVYTSRSPDLGSSLRYHQQSRSGLRCSYIHRCSWSHHRAALLASRPRYSRQCHCPAFCVCVNTRAQLTLLTGSHSTRTAWCQPGIDFKSPKRNLTSYQVSSLGHSPNYYYIVSSKRITALSVIYRRSLSINL